MRPANENYPPPAPRGSNRDPRAVSPQAAPLPTSTQESMFLDGTRQSSITNSVPPPPSWQRTVSDPVSPLAHSPSRHDLARTATVPVPPKSAGLIDKNLKFASGSKSPNSPGGIDKSARRRSYEPKVNVYTECGRHSDEWLFGGFSVADALKKLWEKEKEPTKD